MLLTRSRVEVNSFVMLFVNGFQNYGFGKNRICEMHQLWSERNHFHLDLIKKKKE